MKIALLGYGKMGKEIEQMAISHKHTIHCIIDNTEDWTKQHDKLIQCDVAIEFSTPENAIHNIRECFKLNIPVVVGTTGWYNDMNTIKNECIAQKKSLFVASNFSIGVNVFFQVNKLLAKLMNNYPEYEVEMTEIHHTAKLDAPSGTAITLANDIIERLERKNSWSLEPASKDEELHIQAVREDRIPGTHEIKYCSNIDEITIRHEAKSRKGFALGAVLAAQFMKGKTGFFGMEDLMGI